jgi:hypothetical protein
LRLEEMLIFKVMPPGTPNPVLIDEKMQRKKSLSLVPVLNDNVEKENV